MGVGQRAVSLPSESESGCLRGEGGVGGVWQEWERPWELPWAGGQQLSSRNLELGDGDGGGGSGGQALPHRFPAPPPMSTVTQTFSKPV